MKKFFFSFVALAAMFLMVSCGGSDSGSSSGSYGGGDYGDSGYGGGDSGSGNGSSSSECDEDDLKCSNSSVYVCNFGSWHFVQECPYGCYNSYICNTNSGGGSSSECDYGDYKCDGNSSYRCSGGSWSYDEYCSNGCNYSTGKCNSSSGGGNSGGGNSSECDYGEYRCSSNVSQRCSSGKWVDDQSCLGVGCNDSTGKCKTQDEHEPCRPSLNGSVSGSSVKLSWSYTTSSSCGTPTTTTLKYYDHDLGTFVEIKSASASSFKSYTLSASTYGYYMDDTSEAVDNKTVKAGIIVENDYGSASAQCVCTVGYNDYCGCN